MPSVITDLIHSEGGEYRFCMTQKTCFETCKALNIIFSQASFLRPIGFSQTTCFLFFRANKACSECKPFGVQILTTSNSKSLFSNSSIELKNGTSNDSA